MSTVNNHHAVAVWDLELSHITAETVQFIHTVTGIWVFSSLQGHKSEKAKEIKTYRETLSKTATHIKSAVPYLTHLLNSYQ